MKALLQEGGGRGASRAAKELGHQVVIKEKSPASGLHPTHPLPGAASGLCTSQAFWTPCPVPCPGVLSEGVQSWWWRGGGLRPWSLAGKSGRRGLLVIQIPGSTWRGGWRHDSDILPVSLAQLTVEREVAGSRLHSPKPGLSCDVALCGPDLEVLKDGSRFSALFLRRPELCLRWKINILLPASYFLHLVLV